MNSLAALLWYRYSRKFVHIQQRLFLTLSASQVKLLCFKSKSGIGSFPTRKQILDYCTAVDQEKKNASQEEIKISSKRKAYLNTISKSPVVVHLKDLDEHMRIRGYSALRWGLALLALAGYGLYHFREPVKEKISVEVSDVASRSLGDQNVVMKANEVTRAVLFEIMNDPDALTMAIDFLVRLLKSEFVVQGATELSLQVINDPSTRRNISLLASHTLNSLLEVKETREMLLDYIKSLLLDDHTKGACIGLLRDLFATPEVQNLLSNLLSDVIRTELVTNYATELGKTVTQQVVTDQQIQQQTGAAMWNAMTYSITPRWFYSSKQS